MTCILQHLAALRAPQVTKVVMGSSEDLVSDRAQVPLSSNVFHFWSISGPFLFHLFHFLGILGFDSPMKLAKRN